MVRIDEFNRWPPDPSILFFTGLFKPIIGFFFAIFVLLAYVMLYTLTHLPKPELFHAPGHKGSEVPQAA